MTVDERPAAGATPPPLDLPVRSRPARAIVLAVVFVCAACGLVYELALVALGSYLVGDTVANAALVISLMVFAMGLGSLAAKPLQRWPAAAFAGVELALALVGGTSVLVLYASYSWLRLYTPALIVEALVIGLLIGAEIPLLMTLLQRIRAQEAGSAVADLFAADYVGALLGGLAFPFLLLPVFGQLRGALVVGMINAVAGTVVVLWLFRRVLGYRAQAGIGLATAVVLLLLVLIAALAAPFEVAARQALYAAPVVHGERTPYQEIVLTHATALDTRPDDLRLYLNGDLQFSSVDEYRYHEALVHPALAGGQGRVLVLGGGDGLAAREVLRHPRVREVVEVELDPAMLGLARTDDDLVALNRGALDDPRVRLVAADAFTWLRDTDDVFDAVVVDMPDPDAVATAKLYSVEFYGLVRQVLAPGARVVVQAGSPSSAREAFWSIEASMATAGLATTPYHVAVPSFGGDWGFVQGTLGPAVAPALPPGTPPLRSLDPATLAASTVFAPDIARVPVEPSTIDRPRIVDYRLATTR